MFDVECRAEIKKLVPKMRIIRDEYLPEVAVTMLALDVPVEKITSAVPDLAKWAYKGDVVTIGEVNPLTVQHALQNLSVTIGDVTMTGCDLRKNMKIHLKPEKVADLLLTVDARHHEQTTMHVLRFLGQEVGVNFKERQLELVENQ